MSSSSSSSHSSDSEQEETLCQQVERYERENDRILDNAARRSGMTRQALEDSYWADEAKARKEVDRIMVEKGHEPFTWVPSMNAQYMLLIGKKQ